MKTSIILPTYSPDNEVAKYLDEFIDTLLANTKREDFELITIENGSFTPRLKEISDIYIHKEKPIGYARAVNLGLAIANEDLFVIVNNDLKVPSNWLEIMKANYHGGTLAPLDFIGEKGIIEDSHWFSCVMFDRDTFTKVGYLDEFINYRYHDQDFSIRVKKSGMPVRRIGDVVVSHINMATYDRMGRPGDEREKQIMIERWGAPTLNEWLKL